MPDALWAEIEPPLSVCQPHPLGYHNPSVDDRRAMDAREAMKVMIGF
jgi:hypothetical protein